MVVDQNLIFDLGLHKGLDARNYLAKGFKVVGLEAVPALCECAKRENREAFSSGRLRIEQRALFGKSGEKVKFFVNADHDDWGSLDRGAAEKGVSSSAEIEVETVSLKDLFSKYGLPYYLKCDLEGGDAILAKELLASRELPTYVSIEATSADDLAMIRACGYNKFQIVNQWMNPFTRAPNPPREGIYADLVLNHHTSGLFGRELPLGAWVDFTKMMTNFLRWYELRNFTENLAIGWLDVHATIDKAVA